MRPYGWQFNVYWQGDPGAAGSSAVGGDSVGGDTGIGGVTGSVSASGVGDPSGGYGFGGDPGAAGSSAVGSSTSAGGAVGGGAVGGAGGNAGGGNAATGGGIGTGGSTTAGGATGTTGGNAGGVSGGGHGGGAATNAVTNAAINALLGGIQAAGPRGLGMPATPTNNLPGVTQYALGTPSPVTSSPLGPPSLNPSVISALNSQLAPSLSNVAVQALLAQAFNSFLGPTLGGQAPTPGSQMGFPAEAPTLGVGGVPQGTPAPTSSLSSSLADVTAGIGMGDFGAGQDAVGSEAPAAQSQQTAAAAPADANTFGQTSPVGSSLSPALAQLAQALFGQTNGHYAPWGYSA